MVHFVGAGCGAADLITLRGKRLLEEADVVIYAGSLVNPDLLGYCRAGASIHDSSRMTLEEVFDVMRRAQEAGADTVRLHTGDPCLYGAVREQMDLLEKAGIPYDCCPGVSSFSGAAAALNLEYTLPGVSQSVIITRMEGRTPVPERESIQSLSAHGATMVIFLSASMPEKLSARLIEGGYGPDTPAAVVQKATWPDQKAVVCTVGTLPSVMREHGITRTALIIVGEAVSRGGFERSMLYHPAFSTMFRGAKEDGEKEVP